MIALVPLTAEHRAGHRDRPVRHDPQGAVGLGKETSSQN